MVVTLKLSNGKSLTTSIQKTSVTIGRSLKCDVVVPEESLSRQHCLVEIEDGGFFITDLESSNGVYLDGERIPPNKKTPFTTFLQLTIGPLDCQIADDSPSKPQEFTAHDITNPALILDTEGSKATQKIRKPSKKVYAVKKKKPQDKKGNMSIAALTVLLIAGAMIYQFFFIKEDKVKGTPTLGLSNVPKEHRGVEDEFPDVEIYQAHETNRSCFDHPDVCADLKLFESQGEGVVTNKNNEYFIFMNVGERLSQLVGQEWVKDPVSDEIYAINTLLKSAFFDLFHTKQIPQIHLILKNKELKAYKVIRFHQKYFLHKGPERQLLLSQLNRIFSGNSSKSFQTSTSPLIKMQLLSYK